MNFVPDVYSNRESQGGVCLNHMPQSKVHSARPASWPPHPETHSHKKPGRAGENHSAAAANSGGGTAWPPPVARGRGRDSVSGAATVGRACEARPGPAQNLRPNCHGEPPHGSHAGGAAPGARSGGRERPAAAARRRSLAVDLPEGEARPQRQPDEDATALRPRWFMTTIILPILVVRQIPNPPVAATRCNSDAQCYNPRIFFFLKSFGVISVGEACIKLLAIQVPQPPRLRVPAAAAAPSTSQFRPSFSVHKHGTFEHTPCAVEERRCRFAGGSADASRRELTARDFQRGAWL